MFVVMGLPKVDAAKFFEDSYDGGFFHGGTAGLISAIAIMGWACQGTTMGPVGVVAITEKPKRTVPLGIVVTCLVVAVIYGLIVAACVVILPLVFSWIALKVKSVDAEILAKARDEIIRDALQEEAA